MTPAATSDSGEERKTPRIRQHTTIFDFATPCLYHGPDGVLSCARSNGGKLVPSRLLVRLVPSRPFRLGCCAAVGQTRHTSHIGLPRSPSSHRERILRRLKRDASGRLSRRVMEGRARPPVSCLTVCSSAAMPRPRSASSSLTPADSRASSACPPTSSTAREDADHCAFVDGALGSGSNAFTCAIAHVEQTEAGQLIGVAMRFANGRPVSSRAGRPRDSRPRPWLRGSLRLREPVRLRIHG